MAQSQRRRGQPHAGDGPKEQQQQPQQQQRDSVERPRAKPLVRDLNRHIVCPLCRGYLVDASTLIECMHTFCRACIVYRLKNGPRTCPVCDHLVSVRPRPDVGLQRLIYLMVPGLFKSELERRRNFRSPINPLAAGGETGSNQQPLGAPELSFDDLVSLSLCELDSTMNELASTIRYLKCPAGVTVRHLLRLLMLKRGWDDADGKAQQSGNNKIELMYELSLNEQEIDFEVLDPSWTLMDLSCIFQWKREAPMRLFYRIIRVDEPETDKQPSNHITTLTDDNSSSSVVNTAMSNSDANNQAIENIQRPPTPPPSPKPALPSRTDTLEKGPRSALASPTTTVVDYPYSKKQQQQPELKKPRCEVTPVMRAPDPPPPPPPPPPVDGSRSKSGKPPKLEHQRKRKKRRNKRVIAEITTTPREDLLKLKLRLTPCPPRVSSSSSGQAKDKLVQIRAVRKEKTKITDESQKPRPPSKELSSSPPPLPSPKVVLEDTSSSDNKKTEVENPKSADSPQKTSESGVPVVGKPNLGAAEASQETGKLEETEEQPPKKAEVLHKLGLVAISEANKANRQEQAKNPSQSGSSGDKTDPALEREKLEKQLRESKANRVRSLLAEKQMRDTLKSIMSNSKETTPAIPSSSSTSRVQTTPATTTTTSSTGGTSTSTSTSTTTSTTKRKEPPPLTPLRNAKRPCVTFAPNSYTINKCESPLDLSSPSNPCKDNALDLSSGMSEQSTASNKCSKDEKPVVGILRTSGGNVGKQVIEKPRDETKKSPDTNLRTLSDAAVSLLGSGNSSLDKSKQTQLGQNYVGSSGGVSSSGSTATVALRIPQPHQRITGFGLKIKPNIGVRHIPNPQAVVASQYRHQRTGYFNITHQPP